jgi:NADH:ubiquinone reductase (H+-translocating)
MHWDIVIIGGGFAGRQACRGLRPISDRVALIDPSLSTVMLPSLPDVAGGWMDEQFVQAPLAAQLPVGVVHLPHAVSAIHLDANTLVAGGSVLSYGQLVIAAGSIPKSIPAEFPRNGIYTLGSLGDALRIRHDFSAYLRETEHPHVLMAGSGYTGLELAMSLFYRAKAAGKSCAVTIVDPTPILLPSLPDRQRQYVLDFLVSQGAEVRLGVAVEAFDGRQAVAGGRTYDNVFFCWAVGSAFAVPELNGRVDRLRDGRLKVRPDLSLPGYPNVFAAGDSAAIERRGQVLRKAVNFAYYGGRHAGRNVARRRRGQRSLPFHPKDLGWIVPFHATSIGRLPGGIWVRGRLGVRLHHLMCGLRNYSFPAFAQCLKMALNPKGKIHEHQETVIRQ